MCIALWGVLRSLGMKEDFDKIVKMAVQTKDVNLFGQHCKKLSNKYGVSERTIYLRFTSLFGASPREYVKSQIWPTYAEMVKLILNTNSSQEVKDNLGLPNGMFVGIYDKFFNVSSYSKAKEKILMTAPAKIRKSTTRDDNISLLMSQHLGDGYYDRKRHSLKVSHGIKQAEYLLWKVGLIHDGYNEVSTKVSIHTHAQGHKYVAWYSCKLGKVHFPEDKTEAVSKLTPLGWLLLYLDDGCYGQDMFITTESKLLAVAMQKELETYGIASRVNICGDGPSHNVTMRGGSNTIKFYKNFIEPFSEIIPKCMKYKTEVKI